MSKKEIKEELNEIAAQLEDTNTDIEKYMDKIKVVTIYLNNLKARNERWQDRIRELSKKIEVERREEEIPFLFLKNYNDFLALRDGILTQIKLSRSFTDKLKIGQEIEISPLAYKENGAHLFKKITQIHNPPFLEESIVHFEKKGKLKKRKTE